MKKGVFIILCSLFLLSFVSSSGFISIHSPIEDGIYPSLDRISYFALENDFDKCWYSIDGVFGKEVVNAGNFFDEIDFKEEGEHLLMVECNLTSGEIISSSVSFYLKEIEILKFIEEISIPGRTFFGGAPSFDFSDNTLIVGRSQDKEVFIYEREGEIFSQKMEINSPSNTPSYFGEVVSIGEDYLIVGDGASVNSGNVFFGELYLYKKSSIGEWIFVDNFAPSYYYGRSGNNYGIPAKNSFLFSEDFFLVGQYSISYGPWKGYQPSVGAVFSYFKNDSDEFNSYYSQAIYSPKPLYEGRFGFQGIFASKNIFAVASLPSKDQNIYFYIFNSSQKANIFSSLDPGYSRSGFSFFGDSFVIISQDEVKIYSFNSNKQFVLFESLNFRGTINSISLFGDYLAVSSNSSLDKGKIYFYKRNSDKFKLVSVLSPPSEEYTLFGREILFTNDSLIVLSKKSGDVFSTYSLSSLNPCSSQGGYCSPLEIANSEKLEGSCSDDFSCYSCSEGYKFDSNFNCVNEGVSCVSGFGFSYWNKNLNEKEWTYNSDSDFSETIFSCNKYSSFCCPENFVCEENGKCVISPNYLEICSSLKSQDICNSNPEGYAKNEFNLFSQVNDIFGNDPCNSIWFYNESLDKNQRSICFCYWEENFCKANRSVEFFSQGSSSGGLTRGEEGSSGVSSGDSSSITTTSSENCENGWMSASIYSSLDDGNTKLLLPCINEIPLPFFGIFGFIFAIIILLFVYLFFYSKKFKKLFSFKN